MNKQLSLLLILIVAAMLITACSDTETYADKRKKEDAAISAYITNNNIEVISESKFEEQGYTTDLDRNQYVLFNSNGIYLQIVRKGCGEPLKSGETATILSRFTEVNLLGDSVQLSNDNLYYSSIPEKMTVYNTSGTFTGSFDENNSLMYVAYSSTSVPSGWLYPLTYVNIGRPVEEDDEIAKVNVIVPAAQGQYYASVNVYPCWYVLTYERGI